MNEAQLVRTIKAPAASAEDTGVALRLWTDPLIKTIQAHLEKGDKATAKAEQHYISAGQRLKELKAKHDEAGDTWPQWEQLLRAVGIGKSRASELMQIADGRKTVEDVREDTNQRKLLHRTPSVPERRRDEPAEEPADAKAVAPDILAKLRAAETKIEELQTENAELRRQLEVFKSPVRCEFVEDDGGRAAAGYGEAEGDCVARAITIATGKPYAEVFEALKAAHVRYVKRLRPGSYDAGFEERRRTEPIHSGCERKVYAPYLRSLGWQYTRTRERLYLRAGALPPGRLIVLVHHHLVAVIDGVIHDTYDSGGTGKRPVDGYWTAARS